MKKAARNIAASAAGLAAAVLLMTPAVAVPEAFAVPRAGDRLVLPRPTGPHPVGRSELHLVDRNRQDPWVPSQPRELMVSVWYPAALAKGTRVPYASAEESRLLVELFTGWRVPADSLTRVLTHARAEVPPLRTRHRLPLVVLSPGFGTPRWLLTTFAEDLASRGYVVVGVDHTYEAAAITFPDGRVTRCVLCTRDWNPFDVAAGRARDVSFVLDRLLAPESAWRHGRMIDPARIAMAGHSLGGAAAVTTMLADRRVDAGMNLDGSFHHVPTARLDRPLLMLGAELHPIGGVDPSWEATWPQLTGWRRWLYVPGMVHFSLCDVPPIFQQLGVPAQPIPGARVTQILRTYIAAFMDQHLRDRRQPLLDGPSRRFPEVNFLDPAAG